MFYDQLEYLEPYLLSPHHIVWYFDGEYFYILEGEISYVDFDGDEALVKSPHQFIPFDLFNIGYDDITITSKNIANFPMKEANA